MKKQQAYAALPHVDGFVTWLASELDNKTLFRHAYVDRRSGATWSCDGLFSAYQSYSWNFPGNKRLGYNPGTSSAENAEALEALRQDLIAAGSDDNLVLKAASDVMAWGGVKARNVAWLEDNKNGLGRMIQEVKEALISGDPDAPVLRSNNLRFNSGMTKVYSLLCEGLCIYDSRVAAALGDLVVQYCNAKGLKQVPKALCFPWAAAKESLTTEAPKRRNPSTGTLHFTRLRSGTHHALWNVRASWLINAVLEHSHALNSEFSTVKHPEDARRAFENGLFMRGYDLGHSAN